MGRALLIFWPCRNMAGQSDGSNRQSDMLCCTDVLCFGVACTYSLVAVLLQHEQLKLQTSKPCSRSS